MEIEWLAAARADLVRIFAFNLQRSEDFAERVDTRLIERAEALRCTPMMGRPLGTSGLRLLPVIDIQYVVIYAVTNERVLILRVHHAREHRENR